MRPDDVGLGGFDSHTLPPAVFGRALRLAARDPRGNLVVATWTQTRYTEELVRARALHVEDWVAVILFNHLISGADAYVAANLWDLPQHLSMRAAPLPRGGAALTFSLSVR